MLRHYHLVLQCTSDIFPWAHIGENTLFISSAVSYSWCGSVISYLTFSRLAFTIKNDPRVSILVPVSMCTYKSIFLGRHKVNIHIYVYKYTWVHIYICVYVYIFISMCIYISLKILPNYPSKGFMWNHQPMPPLTLRENVSFFTLKPILDIIKL